MARIRRSCVAICLAIPWIALSPSLLAQSSECTGKEAQAQLPSFDPAYVDAMELARYLIDHGFIVKCVGKPIEIEFEGQKGAALYRTNRGSFVAVFLPKGQNFDALEVVEQRQGARYLYSFRGTPRSPAHIDSSKPIYYVKFGNVLFDVWGNADLAASIKAAVTQ